MKNNNLNNLIKYGTLQLDSWCVIGIYGDTEKVVDLLQGQVTSDINKKSVDAFQLRILYTTDAADATPCVALGARRISK